MAAKVVYNSGYLAVYITGEELEEVLRKNMVVLCDVYVEKEKVGDDEPFYLTSEAFKKISAAHTAYRTAWDTFRKAHGVRPAGSMRRSKKWRRKS